jgi:hypothetical protein
VRRPGACGLHCTCCCSLVETHACDSWSRVECSCPARSRLACCLPTTTAVFRGMRRLLLAAAKREHCQMLLAALLLAARCAALQGLTLQAAMWGSTAAPSHGQPQTAVDAWWQTARPIKQQALLFLAPATSTVTVTEGVGLAVLTSQLGVVCSPKIRRDQRKVDKLACKSCTGVMELMVRCKMYCWKFASRQRRVATCERCRCAHLAPLNGSRDSASGGRPCPSTSGCIVDRYAAGLTQSRRRLSGGMV